MSNNSLHDMLHPNQLNETGRIASVYRLSETTVRMDVLAPLVAKSALPGQFIIFRTHKTGERIPLTIADINSDKISLIFQEAGYSTKKLGAMKPGDKIEDLLGPLGQPSVIEKFGTVVAVGGGVGAAVLYPEVKALKAAGNRIITIIGARSKELIILEKELGDVSDSLYVTTDDGSLGEKGLVTDLLKKILESEKTDLVLAIGPIVMMKYVSLLTKTFNVKTIVSLNPIMVDGTGMCGACRVDIDGKTKFACVDGPEFDGHQVNYDILMQRNRQYEEVEKLKS